VQGSTDVSFLRGPSGIPTSTAVVHGTNGSIKLTNFLVPFLKRGNSIVVRAADGTVVSKVMLTDRRSTFEHQMTAFARQVHEVRQVADAGGYVHTGQYASRFVSVLDSVYVAAGMEPRPSPPTQELHDPGSVVQSKARYHYKIPPRHVKVLQDQRQALQTVYGSDGQRETRPAHTERRVSINDGGNQGGCSYREGTGKAGELMVINASIQSLGAWGVRPDGKVEAPNPLSKVQAHQAVLRAPCNERDSDIWYGDNAYPQRAFAFGGSHGAREFTPAMAAVYRGEGYILLRASEDEEHVMQLRAFSELLTVFNLSSLPRIEATRDRQPHRRKNTLWTSEMSEEAMRAVPRLPGLVKAYSRVRAIFFIAYHLLRERPDYEQHRVMDAETDYFAKVLELATISIQDNLAHPGATFQNPHWDFPNFEPPRVFIDIPMVRVRPGGAPLEIWPSSHRLLYSDTFVHYDTMLQHMKMQHMRQYFFCFPELNTIASLLPSALLYSTFGDAIVRNPSAWHRGTPNRLEESRHMITLVMQPKMKLAMYRSADGSFLRKEHRWG